MKSKICYIKHFICFDIETTHEKVGDVDIIYTWHWSVLTDQEKYYTPTSWNDFYQTLDNIYDEFSKNGTERIIIYVHNLSYEMEAIIRNLCEREFSDGFYMDTHEPLYFIIDKKYEFRCTYKLTNKSLAACGDDVGLPKLEMCYTDIVKPGEKLPPDKEMYCRRDVDIMLKKIRQLEKQEEKPFWKFPYTNTGFLRDELRTIMKKDRKWMEMFKKTALSYDTYLISRKAFMGGYTHANFKYAGKIMKNVDSFDFGSAYPFAMATQKFPCSPFIKVQNPTAGDLFKLSKMSDILYICTLTMENVSAKSSMTFLSTSHCEISEDVILDNGRIYKAGIVKTTCTSLDIKIIFKMYKISAIRVDCLYYCKADYLPSEFINTMFKYYEKKQSLKCVVGMELEYMKAKERVNSFYGMCVQDPIHEMIELNGSSWKSDKISLSDKDAVQEQLDKFYNSPRSFLPYQIGVFIPAYTRYFLMYDIVSNIAENVVYCDTDSAKVINYRTIVPIVKQYNDKARKMVADSLARNHYDANFPDLGYFDHETEKNGAWKEFVTYGAKKYALVDAEGRLQITVSGLSKKATNYLSNINNFRIYTTFDKNVSGRTISHPTTNEIPTYDNGGTWIEDTTYTLSVAPEYAVLIGVDMSKIVPTLVTKDGIVENNSDDIEKRLSKFKGKVSKISPLLINKMEELHAKY